MMATLSDPSGQFVATVFDEEPTQAVEAAARSGSCGLIQVELDRRPGDEVPRVTIKRFQPLESLARRAKLQMAIRLSDASVAGELAILLAGARGGSGVVRLFLPLASGGEAAVLAGRDFALDAELVAQVERITGEGSVDLSVHEPPRLSLVG